LGLPVELLIQPYDLHGKMEPVSWFFRERCTTTFVAVIPEATHYKKTPEKAHTSQIRGF
jgi:hypothetical protein